MKSFTEAYFNYGYNTTIEKIAAKKKEDEGMGWGAKLGLGALGAAGLGAGAYYSPEILSYLSDSAGGDVAQALGSDSLSKGLSSASDWAQTHIQNPMGEIGSDALNYLKDVKKDTLRKFNSPEYANPHTVVSDVAPGSPGEIRKLDGVRHMLSKPALGVGELRAGDQVANPISAMGDIRKLDELRAPIDTSVDAIPSFKEAITNTKNYWTGAGAGAKQIDDIGNTLEAGKKEIINQGKKLFQKGKDYLAEDRNRAWNAASSGARSKADAAAALKDANIRESSQQLFQGASNSIDQENFLKQMMKSRGTTDIENSIRTIEENQMMK